MTGLFVTFEGIDFCGKSVQLELLTQKIVNLGKSHLIIREPGGTIISEKIRDVLLEKSTEKMDPISEIFLYSAARAQLTRHKIIPGLQSGNIVICDRFFDSTTAYQGYGRGIDLDFVKQINRMATQNILPDITFLLDITIDEMEKRKQESKVIPDRMEDESRVFFEKVRQGYLTIGSENPERFVIIDGSRKIPEIETEIWKHVYKYLQGGEDV
ncbi:dTMP kinase [candidate division KSB1 bacterium]|nr:dTMP kinase [candidate division KSB1 bacterium]